MTNQLETAKEWIADLNKIIDKTDNECTKQKRDVLEWLVEEIEQNQHYLRAVEKSMNEAILIDNCDKAIDHMYGILGKALKGESK